MCSLFWETCDSAVMGFDFGVDFAGTCSLNLDFGLAVRQLLLHAANHLLPS